jgi:ATP-dependent Clp protease ATP-binding subunit ClpC
VEEPNKETATTIISGLKEVFEEYHNLNITQEAVEEAVDLSIRYITDRYLPDKAIDLIDEACSLKSMKYNIDEDEIKNIKEKIANIDQDMQQAVIAQSYKKAQNLREKKENLEKDISKLKQKFSIPKDQRLSVTTEDIQKVLSMTSGIPVTNISKDEIEKLKNLSKEIQGEIIGQEEAVSAVVKTITKNKA